MAKGSLDFSLTKGFVDDNTDMSLNVLNEPTERGVSYDNQQMDDGRNSSKDDGHAIP
jgi:hypothetical protein